MTRSSFSPLVTRRALFLLVLPLRAALGFPCGDVDCDEGFCIQQDIGGYQCICIDGYEGEHCNKIRRSTRGTKNDASCDAMPCQNGGTCIPTVDEMSGEAPMDMGESMLDCGVEGSCYTCRCAPGFTGPRCSETIRKCVLVLKCKTYAIAIEFSIIMHIYIYYNGIGKLH